MIRASDLTVGDFDGRRIIPKKAGNPKRPPNGLLAINADLCGDFRDELVVIGNSPKGERVVSVITAVAPIQKRFVEPGEKLEYRLWLGRNMGGGYESIRTQSLVEPGR